MSAAALAVDSFALRCYALSLAFFHTSELLLAAAYNPADLGPHSLLLSWPYAAAHALALAEHCAVTRWGGGRVREARDAGAAGRLALLFGLALVLAGEALRKAALVTAGRHFTHRVAVSRRPGHSLVTGGVYACLRHPGYAGFAAWALGTQVLLRNPCSLVAFCLALRRFFRRRVAFEEARLADFFGDRWQAYRRATPSGLAWLTG